MFIDYSSRPPVAEMSASLSHLENYRRVYRSSEAQVPSAGPEALADWFAAYERLGAHRVVIKARDVESTFGYRLRNEIVAGR